MTIQSSSIALALICTVAGCAGEASPDTLRSQPAPGCDDEDHQALDISDILAGYDAGTSIYADPAMWLAGPDAVDDFVLSVNLDTTIVNRDLSTEVIHPERAVDPELDIFYIHPTVNLNPEPGTDDLSDQTNTKLFAAESVARFSTIARVIAPLYHSATAGVFFPGMEEVRGPYLEIAYADVEEAFRYYLANHWNGRKLVIMGWSQGGAMARMLVQRVVADHPELMSRVVAVLPMSADLQVDSFAAIPSCEAPNQTGCYITFSAYLQGDPPQAGTGFVDWIGTESACTDVTGATGDPGVFSLSYFSVPQAPDQLPTAALNPIPIAIDTPFMAFPEYYAGNCVDAEVNYFEVRQADPEGDQRWNPINTSHPFASTGQPFGLGLHIFDYSLGMGDLLELVKQKDGELEDESDFCVLK